MTFEEALVAHVAAHPAVTAAGVADRIFPNYLPQEQALPAVMYERASGPRTHSHDGVTGLTDSGMVFHSYAATKGDAKKTTMAIRLALDGFKGSIGGGEIRVDHVFLEDEDDGWDDELECHVYSTEYSILHTE